MPNSGLENYHLPTHKLPHNNSKRTTPFLGSASMGSTSLCCLTSGTFQNWKASILEIGDWAPTVCEKKKEIRNALINQNICFAKYVFASQMNYEKDSYWMQFTKAWIVTARCIWLLLERLQHHLPVVFPTSICPYTCKLRCNTSEAAFHFRRSKISDHTIRRVQPSSIDKNLRTVIFCNSSD